MESNISVSDKAGNAAKVYFVTDYWGYENLTTYSTEYKTWYSDAEKLAETYGLDGNVCWGASSCNVLQTQGWNRAYANEDRLLDYWVDRWPLWGGYAVTGFSWWLTGKALPNYETVPPGGAKYKLSDSALNVFYNQNEAAEKTYSVVSYFDGSDGQTLFSQLCGSLESGYCLVLSIGGHAITCWGYEINGEEWYLYISDSDDGQTEKVDRRLSKNELRKCEAAINAKGELTIQYYSTSASTIKDFTGLAVYDPVYEGVKETLDHAVTLSLPSCKAGYSTVVRNGTIALAEDKDYYCFESPVNGTLTVTLSAARTGGTCSLKFSLLDENGKVLQTAAADKSNTITADVAESRYYILVEDGGQTLSMLDAPYSLSLTVDGGSKPDLVFADVQSKKGDLLAQHFVLTCRDVTSGDANLMSLNGKMLNSKSRFYADETIYASFITTNVGAKDAASYLIQAYIDDKLVKTVTASGAVLNQQDLYSLDLGTLSAGTYQVTIKLNMEDSIPEMRYDNNVYSRMITVGTAKNHTCGSDFNGNRIADITLVYKNGTVGFWMDADSTKWKSCGSLDLSSWTVVGSGDFKQDGKDDLLLYQKASGILGYWNDGDSTQWTTIGTAGSGWEVLGVMDVNHNGGRNDVVLKNDDYIYAWLDGSSEKGSLLQSRTGTSEIWENYGYSASGDVDGDGFDELLFQSENGKKTLIVPTDAEKKLDDITGNFPCSLKAAGDFNHDEYDDILFSTSTESGNVISVFDSCLGLEKELITLSEDWLILGARDYNNDLYCDVLLENTALGIAGYWHGSASGLDISKFTTVGNGLSSDWKVIC